MFIVLIVLYTDTATATQNAHSRVSCDNELKLSDVNQFDSMVIVMWKKVDMVFLFGLEPFCMHSVHEHLCSVLPSLLEWKSMNRINWCNLTFCFYFGFVSCFFLCVRSPTASSSSFAFCSCVCVWTFVCFSCSLIFR